MNNHIESTFRLNICSSKRFISLLLFPESHVFLCKRKLEPNQQRINQHGFLVYQSVMIYQWEIARMRDYLYNLCIKLEKLLIQG